MSRYVILLIIRVYRGSSLWPHFVSTHTLATLPTCVKSPLLPPMEPLTSLNKREKQICDTYAKMLTMKMLTMKMLTMIMMMMMMMMRILRMTMMMMMMMKMITLKTAF